MVETLKDILNNRIVFIQTAQGPICWKQEQGSAQGSCSGPMFWNLAANEILSQDWQSGVNLQVFAGDFIFVISEPTNAKFAVQAALNRFKIWSDKHKLTVSIEKSNSMLISELVNAP
ncbi:hypothetical protein AVEN_131137-1 [Araneus ventricosus]|uniref:Reverse transcriptase domain-containing protein n=1 Tax=Araneus ventricosus TaxID=182803 RepID=A0A4Y2HCF4_ARAVE|nr:hypothetical protein AVEN_131137-1 [Araneus ventricosus]